MSFRVAILGIDGSGKSTLVRGLEQRLSQGHSVISIGQRVTLHDKEGQTRDLLAPIPGKAHPLRHFFRNLERHWALQRLPSLLDRHRSDICLEDRDGCIDLCALATAHIPALCYLSPRLRVALVTTITRRRPADMYLFLDVPVWVAEERIRRKLRQTRRRRAFHERLDRLERVAGEYQRFLVYLKEEGIPVVRLDGSRPAEAVLGAACRSLLQEMTGKPAE